MKKEISLIDFYENYVTINGQKPNVTDLDRALLNALESGSIQRVWSRAHGCYVWKEIKK